MKIYIHLVWSTKNRIPFLETIQLRNQVWNHIKENAGNKHIFVDTVTGHSDHCHCLISLGTEQTISKIVQLIKGESAFWINNNNLCKGKFAWQDEYFAVSVSESMLDKVRDYIKRQEEHHQHKTFQQEYDEFIKKYGFKNLG